MQNIGLPAHYFVSCWQIHLLGIHKYLLVDEYQLLEPEMVSITDFK